MDQVFMAECLTLKNSTSSLVNIKKLHFYSSIRLQKGPTIAATELAPTTNLVIETMKLKKVSFRWRQLYEAKLKDVQEAENKAIDRLKQLYKKEDASSQVLQKRPLHSKSAEGKQSRQVQLCTKVPPSSKRSFFAGSGPGYNLSNVKSNIMKKAKIDYMKSQEVKNLAAMRKKAVQSHHRGTPITKSSGLCGKNSASTSKHTKPLERRF